MPSWLFTFFTVALSNSVVVSKTHAFKFCSHDILRLPGSFFPWIIYLKSWFCFRFALQVQDIKVVLFLYSLSHLFFIPMRSSEFSCTTFQMLQGFFPVSTLNRSLCSFELMQVVFYFKEILFKKTQRKYVFIFIPL